MESRALLTVMEHAVSPRRVSLLTLGAAALATALGQPIAAFSKKGSSRKTKKLKQAKKRCQQDLVVCEMEIERCVEQRAQCFSLFVLACEGDPDPPTCLARGRRCCAPLAQCKVGPFLRCLA